MAKRRTVDLKDRIVTICRIFDLPAPVTEHRFHPVRRWRFDCAWPDLKCAVECHGGGFIQGRHNRALGMTADFEKERTAVLDGWLILYYTVIDLAEHKMSARADDIRQLLAMREGE